MGKRAAQQSRRRRRTGKRRGRGRLVPPVLALALVSLGCGAALAHYEGRWDGLAAAPPEPVTAPPTTAEAPTATTTAKPPPPPAPKPPPKRPAQTPKPEASPEKTDVPRSGPGTFTTARAVGEPVGAGGQLRRYRVQVEDGVDVSAKEAAAEIERILAHPRGWAAHGRGRFQLVTDDADFVIRIATPDTADKLCAAHGMDTRGELNCETTEGVVVNLRRWMLGSPTFAGPPHEYRHLIINHEVGHEIGIRQHMGCPGQGRPAPVMMQQIKGLKGCRSNAYPYDEEGIYIEGPLVS
ncbi:DUF3152 domain-containing protein [Streptomyces roseicoloratus]|uniref:DUF3152 domain-containing protein n=1 Tax=Streptomyces roseicoloratus TaxID=2508722 RepID=A0ABY9RW89_9ACTN|nr:DUF3152 domain-containing protein [Streptomyces roseicoloratus]WMX46280.1 DUF3152 domain-containing protein [Streptomyces roseicoloratus]